MDKRQKQNGEMENQKERVQRKIFKNKFISKITNVDIFLILLSRLIIPIIDLTL